MATLKDEDAPLDNSKWQWWRGPSNTGPWTEIQGQTNRSRQPVAADVGNYLRATVTYTDKHGSQTAEGVTDNPVEARTLANAAPSFAEIDPINVNENVGGNIGDPIGASDGDNDVLLYALDGPEVDDNKHFSMSPSGQLSVKYENGLNYELTGDGEDHDAAAVTGGSPDLDPDTGDEVYTVKIKATDPSGAVGRANVTVNLKDVNELPVFDKASKEQATVYIAENTAGPGIFTSDSLGTDLAVGNVGVYNADDNDGTVDGDADYSLEGADAKYFTITSSGGDGTLAAVGGTPPTGKATLNADFEEKNSYSITIVAKTTRTVAGTTTDKYGRLDVTVRVVDQNDAGEVMLSAREPQVGRSVLASLHDDDGGETAIKWYWFRGTDDDATVTLAVLSGKLTAADRTVTDGETCTAPGASPENIPGDGDPCFIAKATSALYTPKAADADPNDDGDDADAHVLYALVGYKDNKSSEVTYAMAETQAAVQLSDPGNTAPKFPDQDLDTAGDQSDTAMRQVDENAKGAKIGEPIVAVDANDDLLVYTIGGPDAASFTVDSGLREEDSDGQLKLKKGVALNFEAQAMHTVTVTATDPSGATDTITVMIEVIDKDDAPTISEAQSAAECSGSKPVKCSYPENGTGPVQTFSAVDEDAGSADIEWSLEGGQGRLRHRRFSQPQPQATRARDLMATLKDEDAPLDKDEDAPSKWQWWRGPSNTGPWTEIQGQTNRSRQPVAADVGNYLRATVTYTDKHGSQTAEGVTDNPVEARTLANAAPSFAEIDPINVNENVGGNIGDPIGASDGDNDVLLYALDGPEVDDNKHFSMSPSGQLSVKYENGLNYELTGDGEDHDAAAVTGGSPDLDPDTGDEVYTVKIKATDPSGAVGRANVTVNLKDVNELPVFDKASKEQATVYIAENTAGPGIFTSDSLGTDLAVGNVGVYNADDNDGTVDGDADYSLEGADAKYFTITSSGGDGTLAAVGGTPPTGKATLNADFEEKNSYSITIVAKTTRTVAGTTTDKYGRLDVTVRVVDQNDAGEVMLSAREPQVGRSVLASLHDDDGGETAIKWYWFRGTDDDATVTLAVLSGKLTAADRTVTDGETCTAPGASPENIPGDGDPCFIAKATSALYTPKAADADPNDDGDDADAHVLYALVGYKDNKSSEVTYAMAETQAAVQLSDPGNTAPKFPDQDLDTAGDQSDTAMRQVDENAKGAKIGEPIVAVDANDDLLVYTIGGPDAASFTVDSGLREEDSDGQLKLKKGVALDFEAQSMHTVTVTATDPSGATDTITVMIEVIDKDDAPTISVGPAVNTAPAFDGDTADRMVYENMPAGTNVGDPVTATDEDQGQTLSYTIGGPSGDYFAIDENGQITTSMKLDYEMTPSHSVTVTASDGEDTDSIAVTIMVGDMHDGCTVEGNVALTNDCEVLLDAKATLEGDGTSLPWSDDTPITEWQYVVVSGDPMRVTQLRLTRRGLEGMIPASLAYLTELTELNLNENSLHGAVPGELGALTKLTMLKVNRNELTGIEMGLGGASSLTHFYAHSNHLRGEIPSDLGMLSNLLWLRLGQQTSSDRPDDGLTGSIPAELGNLSSVTNLYLHRNKLSGSIPEEIGDLTTLRRIRLDRNDLTGEIPDLSGLTNLDWLGLYGNDLTGSIPATLGMLSSLKDLYLHDNDLTGAVPTEIGSLSELNELWLKDNQLSGILPSSLNDLENLERVRISGNSFEGCVPAALANAAKTDTDDLGLDTCGEDGS